MPFSTATYATIIYDLGRSKPAGTFKMAKKVLKLDPETLSSYHRIVSSDVAHVLEVLPSYNTLRFRRLLEPGRTTATLALIVGICGDSDVRATLSGNVCKVVSRASDLRSLGYTVLVETLLNGQFKPESPFEWSSAIKSGLVTPMRPMTKALVCMYMHIFAAKELVSGNALPPLMYNDLHQALSSLEKAFEISELLPQKQRPISTESQKLYMRIRPQPEPASDTETASTATILSRSTQPISMSDTEVESPATEFSGIHLVGQSSDDCSNATEEPIVPLLGPEDCLMNLNDWPPEDMAIAPSNLIKQCSTKGIRRKRMVEGSPVVAEWAGRKWIKPSPHPRVFPAYLTVQLPGNILLDSATVIEESRATGFTATDLDAGSPAGLSKERTIPTDDEVIGLKLGAHLYGGTNEEYEIRLGNYQR
jgi:hypothetical protein